MNVPFVDLGRIHEPLRSQLNICIENVIKENMFILGDNVKKFEKDFAGYCGVKYGAGVSTGTDALELILRGYD